MQIARVFLLNLCNSLSECFWPCLSSAQNDRTSYHSEADPKGREHLQGKGQPLNFHNAHNSVAMLSYARRCPLEVLFAPPLNLVQIRLPVKQDQETHPTHAFEPVEKTVESLL